MRQRTMVKGGVWFACASVLALQLSPAYAEDLKIIRDVGFETPESVEYDSENDLYLVSNINGHPLVADDNGFVSKVSPNGDVIDLKWLESRPGQFSLHAPKGLAISEDRLFVADLSEIHVFRLSDGEHLNSVPVRGASLLNGITPGPTGSVMVTDTGYKMDGEVISSAGTEAVYQVWPDGRVEAIFDNGTLGHPNGIFYAGEDQILIVTWDSGELLTLDSTGKVTALPKPPSGTLDGVEKLADGRILVSSWEANAIFALAERGAAYTTLLEDIEAPADLGLDTKRNRLLVPLSNTHEVVVYELEQ